MLFAAVVLKFVPAIVTVVPMGPDVGKNEVIVGSPTGVALASLLYGLSNHELSTPVTRKKYCVLFVSPLSVRDVSAIPLVVESTFVSVPYATER